MRSTWCFWPFSASQSYYERRAVFCLNIPPAEEFPNPTVQKRHLLWLWATDNIQKDNWTPCDWEITYNLSKHNNRQAYKLVIQEDDHPMAWGHEPLFAWMLSMTWCCCPRYTTSGTDELQMDKHLGWFKIRIWSSAVTWGYMDGERTAVCTRNWN